jgi:Lysozyme inhibitor LprI
MKQTRLIHLILNLLLAAVLLAVPARAIDCTKATLVFEKAICASPILIKKDEELNLAYKQALQNVAPKDRQSFKTSQQMWLREMKDGFDWSTKFNRDATNDLEHFGSAMDARIRLLTGQPDFGPGAGNKIVPVLFALDHPEGINFKAKVNRMRFAKPTSKGEKLFNEQMGEINRENESEVDIEAIKADPDFPNVSADTTAEANLTYASPKLISAHVDWGWSISNMPHGQGGSYNVNIDLVSGKELAFHQVFEGSAVEQLTELCVAGRDDKEAVIDAETRKGIKSTINEIQRWSLRPNGAIIDFKPYELGGYIQPIHSCELDESDLRGLVKKGFELWQ